MSGSRLRPMCKTYSVDCQWRLGRSIPFLFWLIHTPFTALKRCGLTKTKKGGDQQRRHWRSTLYFPEAQKQTVTELSKSLSANSICNNILTVGEWQSLWNIQLWPAEAQEWVTSVKKREKKDYQEYPNSSNLTVSRHLNESIINHM